MNQNIEVEFVNDDEAADNNDWQSSSSHVGTIVEADTHPSPIETDYAMKRSRSDVPIGDEQDDEPVSAAARPLTRINSNSINKKALMFGLAALAAIILISVGAGYMSSSNSNDTTKVSSASMAAPWVEDNSEGYAPYVTRSNPTSKGSKMMHGNVKEDSCSSGKSAKKSKASGGGGKSGKNRRLRQQQRQLSGKSGGKSKKKTGCSTKSAKKSKGGSKGSKGRRL